MKLRKKTLDAIHSILTDWHGADEAGNVMVEFHPRPLGIGVLVDSVVAKALPPWERNLNELRLSWTEIAGAETARRCRVSHLNEGVLYIEVFHPACRMALDTPKIKTVLLEKARARLGGANCRELKFIPVGRSAPAPLLRTEKGAPSRKERTKGGITPDLPLQD